MKKLAECHYTLTKDLFYEGMLRVLRKRDGVFTRRVILVLLAAWTLISVFSLHSGGSVFLVGSEFVVVMLVILWILVYIPRHKASSGFKDLRNRCGDDLDRTVIFYSDHLEVLSSGTSLSVGYDEIADIITSRNLLILIPESGPSVAVTHDGYTLGSEESVLDNLSNKLKNTV